MPQLGDLKHRFHIGDEAVVLQVVQRSWHALALQISGTGILNCHGYLGQWALLKWGCTES